MAGARDPDQLLGLGSLRVSILAELARVRPVARYEEQRSRRDDVDVVEGVKVVELDLARDGRLRGAVGRGALGRELAAAGAVKVKELDPDCRRVVRDLEGRAAVDLDLAAVGLGPAGGGRPLDNLPPVLGALGLAQPAAARGAHVVHARCGDGPDSRVDLGGADDEAAAAADAQRPDALAVDGAYLGAEVVDRRAEGLGVFLRRHAVARLALAAAPVREVQRDGHEALLGQLGRVQVRALLLCRAHGVADHDGGRVGAAAEVGLGEEVARDGEVVLGLEGDRLDRHNVTLVPIVGPKRQVLRCC